MKKCCTCKIIKNIEDFNKETKSFDGLQRRCRSCQKLSKKRDIKSGKNIKYLKKYYKENKEELNFKNRQRKEKNKEELSLKKKEWRKNNPEKTKAAKARRRMYKNNASINLSAKDSAKIEMFYKNCPKDMQVDHIIPLNNKDVCGLHVLKNLQYLTKEENFSKNNKWDGTIENLGWKNV